MALSTVLDTLDGVDDALKSQYAEQDGKFLLQISGVDDHPDVKSLKVAYERTKEARKEAETKAAQAAERLSSIPEDFDADVWAKAKEGKADEAAIAKVQSAYEAKLDEADKKLKGLQASVVKTALERDLTEALTGAGVTDPSLAQGARALLAGMVQVGDDGNAFAETPFGPKPLGEFVKMWVAGDGKSFVTAAKGGGAKGGEGQGGEENPWKKETINLTRQGEIMKTDPARAQELKRAAQGA